MADIKAGEPFGLDTSALAKIDWALALERVIHDLRSDFIYAPHLSFIYSKAGDELIARRADPLGERAVLSAYQGGELSPRDIAPLQRLCLCPAQPQSCRHDDRGGAIGS